MSAWPKRLVRAVLVLIAFWIFAVLVFMPITIQLRLWRNGAIAAQLVESLRGRFPGADFRGAASYESEVIYIQVVGGLGDESFPEVEQWLRRLKAEQRIAPEIWLRFPNSSNSDEDTIKIAEE